MPVWLQVMAVAAVIGYLISAERMARETDKRNESRHKEAMAAIDRLEGLLYFLQAQTSHRTKTPDEDRYPG